ncbi:hypothetical protein TL16_g04745 [Triparma laevis f. inornata]|uniref:Amine oxidase n=1 Tax=Triparma laevis f. inornata TaxID=1714386 RepID=A0A9W7A827_9STRA|nr:hypothetical protein TL16_g04745 [Triparma laevis f. inornata]
MTTVPTAPARVYKIIVIGAGAAGLAAAKSLSAIDGVTVTVLEGRDRIGGRIDSREIGEGGPKVDMGAAWVNGNNPSNPLTPSTVIFGSLAETDWDAAKYFEAVGTVNNPTPSSPLSGDDLKRMKELHRVTWALFKRRQSAALLRARKGKGLDDTLWNTVCSLKSKKFKGYKSLCERDKTLMRFAWEQITDMEYAATPESLSMIFWDCDNDQHDDMFMFRDGFKTIAEQWAADVDDIRLDCKVESIDVYPNTAGGGVSVKIRGSTPLFADACIVTLPLGVLKAGCASFRGLLLGGGGEGEEKNTAKECNSEDSDSEESEEDPHVLYRVPMDNARKLPEALETPFIVNLKPVTGENILAAYLTTASAALLEEKSNEEIQVHILKILGSMYGEETVKAANVTDCEVSRWASDEFACGSYSYMPANASPRDRAVLSKAEGPLFFAGEHTSHGPFIRNSNTNEGGYPSTVYGAYLSGERAASEAAKLLGLDIGKKRPQSEAPNVKDRKYSS